MEIQTSGARWRWALALLNVAVIAVMQVTGTHLKPGNIVVFEFAGTAEHARQMVEQWAAQGVLPQLGFLIGFDYVFMFTYATFLAMACFYFASRTQGFSHSYWTTLGWLQPVAGILDAVENAALFQIISGNITDFWARVSAYCAAPKFLFTGVAVLSLLIASTQSLLSAKRK